MDTGSSSNGGGTWPYTISQLISSKSEHRKNGDKTRRKKFINIITAQGNPIQKALFSTWNVFDQTYIRIPALKSDFCA